MNTEEKQDLNLTWKKRSTGKKRRKIKKEKKNRERYLNLGEAHKTDSHVKRREKGSEKEVRK